MVAQQVRCGKSELQLKLRRTADTQNRQVATCSHTRQYRSRNRQGLNMYTLP